MFVRCPGCQTTYRLGAERVPAAGLRMRCPGCGNVFRVRDPGTQPAPAPPSSGVARPTPAGTQPVPTPPAMPVPRLAPEAIAPVLGLERDDRRPPRPGTPARTPPAPRPATPMAPRPAPWHAERTLDLGSSTAAPPRLETPPFQPGMTATPTPPAPAAGDVLQGAQERARRLARALVSDILVYNQDTRDRALLEGNLASALGGEVNRAWDVYKSKVDPQVLRTTSFFKDALNEILAGGQRLF